MNKRISKEDRNLIKGALRRIFMRSILRKKIIDQARVPSHTNPDRPHVKNWYYCATCKMFYLKQFMVVDHINPVIRLQETTDQLTFSRLINRIWCKENNLIAICKNCHKIKTKDERTLRTKRHRKRKIENKKKEKEKEKEKEKPAAIVIAAAA